VLINGGEFPVAHLLEAELLARRNKSDGGPDYDDSKACTARTVRIFDARFITGSWDDTDGIDRLEARRHRICLSQRSPKSDPRLPTRPLTRLAIQ
jgi:hypothetical protein